MICIYILCILNPYYINNNYNDNTPVGSRFNSFIANVSVLTNPSATNFSAIDCLEIPTFDR